MKNKYFLICVFVLVSTMNANAVTLTDCIETNTTCKYDNTTVFYEYNLDSSDVFNLIDIHYDISKFPNNHYVRFYDSYNNTYDILTQWYQYDKFTHYEVIRKTSIYINNEIQDINSVLERRRTEIFYANDSFIMVKLPFSNQIFEASTSIYLANDEIYIITKKGLTGSTTRYVKSKNLINANRMIQTNTTNSEYYDYVLVNIEYSDSGKSKRLFDLEKRISGLNFFCWIIFSIVDKIIDIVNFITVGNVFNDSERLNLKQSILEPLEYMSFILNTIFLVIRFILTIGLWYSLMFVAFVLFIYAYATSGDILTALNKFIDLYIKFLTYVLIKPTIYLYEKILTFLKLIRGG